MKVTISTFMNGTVMIALVLGMSACNSSDSTGKVNDSVTTASDSAKIADSATRAVVKKKKKGITSVSVVMADNTKMVKDIHGVYNRAEKAPEFPGGQSALANYINKNLTYPQTAVDNGTNGTVRITFIVDEHGKVLNPQVTDGTQLGDGLADETLTAFNKMPLWTPGTVHGKKVKTRLVLPVSFELSDAN